MGKTWIALLVASLLLLSGCGGDDIGTTPPLPQPDNGVLQPDAPPQTGDSTTADSKLPEKTEGSDTQPESDDPTLHALQAEIADSGALFGVAYLGYADLPYWMDVAVYVEANGFSDEFPFLLSVMEDHAVLQEGGEVYAVVPASKDVSLTISALLMDGNDDFIPDRGTDFLTVTDGKPILLRGNVSEIVPNLLITAEKTGCQPVEYSPCISGMDGSLVTDDSAYDFTPYHLLSGYDTLPDPAFTLHTWYAQHQDGDGNLLAMTLILDADGTVNYSCGWPYSGVFERFEGIWKEEHGVADTGESLLILEMTGGPVDDFGVPVPDKQYETTCQFTWDMQGGLVLRHEGGAPLLYGTENAQYNFMSFDGFHMVNSWTTRSEHWGWYYDLQLLENETCAFSIGEINGGELAHYEGTWHLNDGVLRLYLWLHSGQHPESPDVEFIYGDYLVEDWTPTNMTLTYLSGAILTPEMEETTQASFLAHSSDELF